MGDRYVAKEALASSLIHSYSHMLTTERKVDTYVVLTQRAAEAWHTLTLEVVQPVQTGGAVEAGIRLALVYLCLTPENISRV